MGSSAALVVVSAIAQNAIGLCSPIAPAKADFLEPNPNPDHYPQAIHRHGR